MTDNTIIAAFDTISEGTLRHEDLARALIPWLKRIPDSHHAQPHINALQSILDGDDPETDEDAPEDIQEAIALLEDYAPPRTTISFHEADGARLGCWPYWPHGDDPDIPRVSDLDAVEVGYVGEVLVVNDHGNATLHTVTGWTPETTEHWSVV